MRLPVRVMFCASFVVLMRFPVVDAMAGVIVLDAKSRAGTHEKTTNNVSEGNAGTRPSSTLPSSSVITDEEEGFFPQHGDDSLLDGSASDMRNRAKARQSNGEVLPNNENRGVNDLSGENTARGGAADNVSRARAYMKNSPSQGIAQLPVVSCDNADNVTGRIGDDSQSGSIITIILNGIKVKARCK
ncbi:MAG: hypothetical protein PHP85_04660 [Gallionella sp.]|nr:hypothetical protein [Gallionella sp.]